MAPKMDLLGILIVYGEYFSGGSIMAFFGPKNALLWFRGVRDPVGGRGVCSPRGTIDTVLNNSSLHFTDRTDRNSVMSSGFYNKF